MRPASLLLVLFAMGCRDNPPHEEPAPTADDPLSAPELSAPPAPLTKEEVGTGRPLFDGRNVPKWNIEGAVGVRDGTLVLGGPEPTRAVIPEDFPEDFRLQFDFYQEGPGPAGFRVHAHLLAADTFGNTDFDDVVSLSLTRYVYRRWRRCELTSGNSPGTKEVSWELRGRPIPDTAGSFQGGSRGLTNLKGCRYTISFEAGPNSQVYLRNVIYHAGTGKP